MESNGEPSFRTRLCDVLDSYLGAQTVEPLRGNGNGTARNGKKRRISAGPGKQGNGTGHDLEGDLKTLQDHPDPPEDKRSETEAALATLLVQCCTHAPQIEFLCSLLPQLQQAGLLEWNPLLELLLSACTPPEAAKTPKTLANKQGGGRTSSQQKSPSGASTPAASPRSPVGGDSALRTGPPERLTGGYVAEPMRVDSEAQLKEIPPLPPPALPAFQPTLCQVSHLALKSHPPLAPLTCLALLRLALSWIISSSVLLGEDEELESGRDDFGSAEGEMDETVMECMKLVRRLTLGDDHLLPSYVLLDETLILGDSIPSDEPLLSFLYEIHKRRDNVVYYFTRTDCQIRSPTFATLRTPVFTLQGIFGEPLMGAELALAVPPHSREWERAMACLKQALRNSVSADWWRRVLVLAPHFQQPDQPNTLAEFSSAMLTEALVLRTFELLRPYPDSSGDVLDSGSWQEWCLFADLLFQIVRSGHVDFLSYLTKLSQQGSSNGPLRSPLLAWLFSQVIRLEAVIDIFKRGAPEDKQRTFSLLVQFSDTSLSELSQAPHVAVLLDWAPSFLISRLSMSHKAMPEMKNISFPAISILRQTDLGRRLKEAEGWWQAFEKSQTPHDFSSLDETSMGRLWFLSHSKSQEFVKTWFAVLQSQGTFEIPGAGPNDSPLTVLRETKPMPVALLTGVGIHSLTRLSFAIEELIAKGQPAASVSMMETYVRVLLASPQSLYRRLLETLLNKYKPGDARMTVALLTVLELLNYRLLPFYRYHNKLRAVWGDLERILAGLLTMPRQHRLYRLTENLSIGVFPNIHRDFAEIKRTTKGMPTSETVNRLLILHLAMVSKTRGFASPMDLDHLQGTVKQILAHSSHAWSEKTLRHFPSLLRELLKGREDVRGKVVLSEWQKVGKAAVSAHTQLFTPASDATVSAYLKNVSREYRRWASVALWTFMEGRPEKLNFSNFARALKEFTPEEITHNVYYLVDFILHHGMTRVQKGEPEAAILARTASSLAYVLWVADLLPYDVTLLALADRDDHPQALSLLCLLLDRPEIIGRVQRYCAQRGPADHWTKDEVPVRADLQAALGGHSGGNERIPPLFDDLCLRAIPVLPVLVGRLVEHDRFDAAGKLLTSYIPLLAYHHSKLMLVRDLLAYYHGTMPVQLVNTLLTLLDPQKYTFTETFANYLKHPASPDPLLNPAYFLHLLTKVAHVLPSMGETLFSRQALNPSKSSPSSRRGGNSPGNPAPWQLTSLFARHQDCATQGQLLLMAAEVELLALPFPVETVAKNLVGAALRPEHVGRMERSNRATMAPRNAPGGAAHAPLYRPGITVSAAQFAETTGIVLAQLPVRFHVPFFEEVQNIIQSAPWFDKTFDGLAEGREKYRYLGWPMAAEANNASEEGTVTSTTQVLGMTHAFGYSVPFEWLGSLCNLMLMQRPMKNGAHLRLCFKMLGPMVPAMAPSRPLFAKTLALLFTLLADVYGRSSETTAEDAAEIIDLVDFLHHCVTLEGRWLTPGDRTAHVSTLKLCTQAVERLHPELQKFFKHLTLDPHKALFAAELAKRS